MGIPDSRSDLRIARCPICRSMQLDEDRSGNDGTRLSRRRRGCGRGCDGTWLKSIQLDSTQHTRSLTPTGTPRLNEHTRRYTQHAGCSSNTAHVGKHGRCVLAPTGSKVCGGYDTSPCPVWLPGSKWLGVFRCDGATWRLKTLSPLPRLGSGQGAALPRARMMDQVPGLAQ